MEPSSILEGVVAYVEVRSNNDNRSEAIQRELEQLGAKVEPVFTNGITHIVFKEGSKRTWTRATKKNIPLVSVTWLQSCKSNGMRMPEKDFPALRPEEIESPLPAHKNIVRWKKMKSMQPCDFDEELARSAERGEKKRKRAFLANRFKVEESTPTSASPVILALETQARSPFLQRSNSRTSTGSGSIPETPPSMKERLERMRREQQLLLSSDGETSPKGAPTEVPLQRQLFAKFAQDFISTGDDSVSDEDGQIVQGTSQMVARLIKRLDSPTENANGSPKKTDGIKGISSQGSSSLSGPQKRLSSPQQSKSLVPSSTSNVKKTTQSNIDSSSYEQKNTNNSLCLSTDSETSLKSKKEKTLNKSNICRRKSVRLRIDCQPNSENILQTAESDLNSSDGDNDKSIDPTSDQNNSSESCKQRVLSPNQAMNVYDSSSTNNTNSMTQISSEKLKQSNTNEKNRVNYPVSRRRSRASAVFENKTKNTTSADKKKATHDDSPLQPKLTNKKKNLFSEPVLAMALFQPQTKELKETSSGDKVAGTGSVNSVGGKGKRARKRNSDVAFFFGNESTDDTSDKQEAKKTRRVSSVHIKAKTARIATEGQSNNSSKVAFEKKKEENSNTAGVKKISNRRKSLVTDSDESTLSSTNNTLGTSMSVLYDSSMSVTRSSRRSIDEFSVLKPPRAKHRQRLAAQSKPALSDIRENKVEIDLGRGSKLNDTKSNFQQQQDTDGVNCANLSKPVKQNKSERNRSSTSESSNDEKMEEPCPKPAKLRHARSLVMEDFKTGGAQQPALVMTSLHRDEQEMVYAIVKKLRVFHMTNNVEASTTHVLCGEPRRTLNLLRAIARGCWVLRKEWILKSLEAERWLEEEHFEMEDEFPAAKKCRLQRHMKGHDYKCELFSPLGTIFVAKKCSPPRKDLVKLIQLCSGQVTYSEQKAEIHIGEDHDPNYEVVKPTWVLDCIERMELQPMGLYLVSAPLNQSQRESSPEF